MSNNNHSQNKPINTTNANEKYIFVPLHLTPLALVYCTFTAHTPTHTHAQYTYIFDFYLSGGFCKWNRRKFNYRLILGSFIKLSDRSVIIIILGGLTCFRFFSFFFSCVCFTVIRVVGPMHKHDDGAPHGKHTQNI